MKLKTLKDYERYIIKGYKPLSFGEVGFGIGYRTALDDLRKLAIKYVKRELEMAKSKYTKDPKYFYGGVDRITELFNLTEEDLK